MPDASTGNRKGCASPGPAGLGLLGGTQRLWLAPYPPQYLLPHCRYDAPIWLSDTVARALDRYEAAHARLPMLEHALLIIDEHCEIDARRVYDQDNKGWKAIANAIKGRLIPDDDQYSLGVCLLSRRLPQNVCHIYLIPEQDAGDFLTLRAENYLPFSLTSGYNYGSIPK